ncbi:MAG TPA: ABC transporter permease [Acetobacteraceae bacterium]|jgi:peptide/nickel transport system permease protein
MSGTRAVSVWQLRWRRLRADRAAWLGAITLLVLLAASYAAPLLENCLGVSGVTTDLFSRVDPPSAAHWLGADDAGRDELARLLRGGQISLSIGLIGALGASLLGTMVGAVARYFRGRTDMVLMRLTDGIIALPTLPLLIILAALDLSKLGFSQDFIRSGAAGYWRIVAIVTLLSWTGVARLVRAATLALNEREFVLAARAQGASSWWILRTHILPNAISPVIVATTLAMGRVILAESALSYLGVGIQPPATSWGSMLTNAQELISTAPLLALYPGLLILLTVIAINFLGDGLQAAIDPRSDPR